MFFIAQNEPFDQKNEHFMLDTIAYLHGRSPRIVHRDLKLQNILLHGVGIQTQPNERLLTTELDIIKKRSE